MQGIRRSRRIAYGSCGFAVCDLRQLQLGRLAAAACPWSSEEIILRPQVRSRPEVRTIGRRTYEAN